MIDVREPDEVLQGSIPSAVNLPLSVISSAFHLPAAEFKEKYGFEKPRLDQEVTFYCRSGKRSTTASDVAKRNGYTKYVYVYRCEDLSNIRAAFSTTRAHGWSGPRAKARSLRLEYTSAIDLYYPVDMLDASWYFLYPARMLLAVCIKSQSC